jgi:hypothetical protein
VSEGTPARAPAHTRLVRRVQRELSLIRLCRAAQGKSYGIRAARLYAFGVAVSYAIAIGFAARSDGVRVSQGLILKALAVLSWIVGALVSLAAARDSTRDSGRDVTALAHQRGFSGAELERARVLAAAWRSARLLILPALLLLGMALVRWHSFGTLAWALVLAAGVVLYAGSLALTLAVLTRLAVAVAPAHARLLVVLFVIAPLVLARTWPDVPNVPAIFAWLLGRVDQLGALVA